MSLVDGNSILILQRWRPLSIGKLLPKSLNFIASFLVVVAPLHAMIVSNKGF
jgi:hypothetical protein